MHSEASALVPAVGPQGVRGSGLASAPAGGSLALVKVPSS